MGNNIETKRFHLLDFVLSRRDDYCHIDAFSGSAAVVEVAGHDQSPIRC
jgi:hypothetical protein